MSEIATDPFDSLPTEDLRQVDDVCSRFEQSWPDKPLLEDFLKEGESATFTNPTEAREALLWGLMCFEIECRLKDGERPSATEYVRRFPGDSALIESVFEKFAAAGEPTTMVGEGQSASPGETIDFQPGNISGIIRKEALPFRFGEYILRDYIDAAGQGIVYKAQPVALDDDYLVALKCIKTGLLATEEEVQRFKLEANALAQLNHSNIIPIYHVGECDGQYYFTMKLIEEGSLKDRAKQFEGDLRASVRLIAKVARAIHYAHQRGILHRDLKPGNILLEENEEPVVIDFGLAKRLHGKKNEEEAICGTINYMPLEQAEGRETLTMAVDIYSLGAVLYHCLTGRPPYQATSFQQFVHDIRNASPPAPSALNSDIPKKLETICLHCLEKVPEQRYETAEHLADDLENWLEDRPVSVVPENPVQHLLRWSRKHPTTAALSSFLVLALVIGTGMVLYFAIQANVALGKAEWLQYLSQIELIHRDLHNGNHLVAKGRLDSCPEAYRDWEYRYLHRLYQHIKPQELVHTDGNIVWNLSLNPKDDTQLATVTGRKDDTQQGNGTLTVWKLDKEPEVIKSTPAHKGYIWEVDWSPNGKWIATAGEDQAVKLWDAKFLRLLARLDPAKSVAAAKLHSSLKEAWSVKFSPSSDMLLTGCEDGSVVIWELQPNKDLLNVNQKQVLHHQFGVWAIEFSPDGKYLATGSGAHERGYIIPKPGEVRIYNFSTWKLIQKIRDHKNACTSATFSPDGKWLISGGYDNAINAYRFLQAKGIFEMRYSLRGHTDRRVVSALVTPDGKYFATGSWDKTVKLWDLKTGQMVRQFIGHRGPISGLAFSPDGNLLFTASGDIGNSGVVRIWDWEIRKHEYTSLVHGSEELRDIAFSPNKKKLLLASAGKKGTIKIWNPRTGALVRTFPSGKNDRRSPVNCIAFHPKDKKYLASGHQSGETKFWNVQTGLLLHTFPKQKLPVLSVCFSSDGKRIASGYGKRIRTIPEKTAAKKGKKYGRVQIWDTKSRKLIYSKAEVQDSIFSVTFSKDGNALISASGVFDENKREYVEGDAWQRIMKSKAEQCLENLSEGHKNKIECARYSPNGNIIATAGSDQQIQLWDNAHKHKLLHTLQGHTADVVHLAFSPNGKRLASAGLDDTVRLWDVGRGQEVLMFQLNENCKSVAFSPDGRYLAAAVADGSVRLYDSGPNTTK